MNVSATGLFAAVISLGLLTSPAVAGDAEKGKKVFNKCKACHVVDQPKNKLGPHLIGIVGRTSGSVEGFKYSKALESANLVWDEATLDKFLAKPKAVVKGTKMSFAGLKKESERADVIAYLKSIPAR
jgi:cytochrome c